MKGKIIKLFEDADDGIKQNDSTKYAGLLNQFMEDFPEEFGVFEYREDALEFVINAWNLGNLKILFPKGNFDKSPIEYTQGDPTNLKLFSSMINLKASKFSAYPNFIVDYEIKEDAPEFSFSVSTKIAQEYLDEMMRKMEMMEEMGDLDDIDFLNEVDEMDEIDELEGMEEMEEMEEDLFFSEEDFEQSFINRRAIILKPQQPFIDWWMAANPTAEDGYHEEFRQTFHEPNIYLINEQIQDIEKWLRKEFDRFFMQELESWTTTDLEWPKKRTYKMFKLWFKVDTSTLIYDTEETPVEKI